MFACLRGKHTEKFNLSLCPQSMTSHQLLPQDSPSAGSYGGVLRSAEQGDSIMWTMHPLPRDRGGHPDLPLTQCAYCSRGSRL